MSQNRKRHHPHSQALVKDVPWTLVGPGSVIHGELLMSGNVLIHGRVEGVVFTDGLVRIAEGGAVDGGIHAHSIEVEGSCEGRLEATTDVVLRRGSVMRGDIDAGILIVDDGARFLGHWIRGEGNQGPKIQAFKDTPGHA